MKRYILLAVIVSAMLFTSCGDDDKLPNIVPAETGTVTDDLGNEYDWVRIGDLDWTTTNALNGEPAAEATYWNGWGWSDAFNDEEKEEYYDEYMPVYGNLMTYEDALASAPDGWRLPTDEDWQRLERTLGMKNTGALGFRGDGVAYKMREKETGCRLGLDVAGVMVWQAVFGWKELNLDWKGEYGFYWTATEGEPILEQTTAFYRKIAASNGRVDREKAVTDRYMSVRWCRDAK